MHKLALAASAEMVMAKLCWILFNLLNQVSLLPMFDGAYRIPMVCADVCLHVYACSCACILRGLRLRIHPSFYACMFYACMCMCAYVSIGFPLPCLITFAVVVTVVRWHAKVPDICSAETLQPPNVIHFIHKSYHTATSSTTPQFLCSDACSQ